MAQPTPYDRYTNFAEEQALDPAGHTRGIAVDAELDRIKQTTDEILNNLPLIQRDDGQLANSTVGLEQLKPGLSVGFTLRGAWQAGVNYVLADGVTYDSAFYRAKSSHLSTTSNRPDLDQSIWELVASFNDFVPGYIPDGSITEVKLANLAVTAAKLADGAVSSSKIADDAVTQAKLADNAVGAAQIIDDAVTNAKLANMATATLKGRAFGAATGDPTDLTWAQVSDILTSGSGNIGVNLLINSFGDINQRGQGNGIVGAGNFIRDRWRAGPAGATVGVTSGVWTLTGGSVEQIVEVGFLAAANFSGVTVTVAVNDLTGGNLTVLVGDQTGTITAGSGVRSVTLTVGGVTGPITVRLTGTAVTYKWPRLGRGSNPPLIVERDELTLCRRYFYRFNAEMVTTSIVVSEVAFFSATLAVGTLVLPTPMRAPPTLGISSAGQFQIAAVGTTFGPSAMSLEGTASRERIHIQYTVVGGTVGAAGWARTLSTAAGHMDISAEL